MSGIGNPKSGSDFKKIFALAISTAIIMTGSEQTKPLGMDDDDTERSDDEEVVG